jgi:hypothetical protein
VLSVVSADYGVGPVLAVAVVYLPLFLPSLLPISFLHSLYSTFSVKTAIILLAPVAGPLYQQGRQSTLVLLLH